VRTRKRLSSVRRVLWRLVGLVRINERLCYRWGFPFLRPFGAPNVGVFHLSRVYWAAPDGNFRNLITQRDCLRGHLRMGDVDDPYFAPFAGILAENVQKTASIRSPNRLGRPSLIVCQASRLTRRPEVRVKRQHINLTPEATRKPTE